MSLKLMVMVQMLLSWLPFRPLLVYLTGLLEGMIGIALFIPKFQVNATIAAIVVFIAFFPANIYSALNNICLGEHQWGSIYLLLRLPLQLILIAWSFFCV